MTMPPEEIEIECSKCHARFKAWHRPSINRQLDAFTDAEIEAMTSTKCPACGQKIAFDALIVEADGTWRMTSVFGQIWNHIDRLAEQLELLIGATQYPIAVIARGSEVCADVPGVYAIAHQSDPDLIVYVGKTETATIAKRAWQHVFAGAGSDLKKMAEDNPTLYLIRWLEIRDPTERHFFEAFAIGVLAPKMNYRKVPNKPADHNAQ